MAYTELTHTLPIIITSKNNAKGYAIGVMDYGPEHHLIWNVVLDANGEIWCVPNPEIRVQGNWTLGRRFPVSATQAGPNVSV